MPAFNSHIVAGGQLQSIWPGSPVSTLLFSAETPASGVASVAVAITPKTASGGQQTVSLQFECPVAGIGAGVFQIQDCDGDPTVAGNFTSINFGGATPGQVVNASLNASGTARVELQTAAQFIRVLCVTTPGVAITVRVRQH